MTKIESRMLCTTCTEAGRTTTGYFKGETDPFQFGWTRRDDGGHNCPTCSGYEPPTPAATLTEDGDTLELGDGTRLRLKIEPDDRSPMEEMNDSDCYGRLGWGRPDRYQYGEVRPADMDGNAEKLHFSQGYTAIWWQPPEDVKRTDPIFGELRRQVITLLEEGFYLVIVKLEERCDHGDWHEINNAALGGCDSIDQPYLGEIVTDLAEEVKP